MVEIHGPNWMIRRSVTDYIELFDLLDDLSHKTNCGIFVLDTERSTSEKTVIQFFKNRCRVELKPPTDNIET